MKTRTVQDLGVGRRGIAERLRDLKASLKWEALTEWEKYSYLFLMLILGLYFGLGFFRMLGAFYGKPASPMYLVDWWWLKLIQ